jgi:predicted SAM-dependent methyltransferase
MSIAIFFMLSLPDLHIVTKLYQRADQAGQRKPSENLTY